MNKRTHWRAALVLGCVLLLAACKDRHEPLKPTVAQAVFGTLVASA